MTRTDFLRQLEISPDAIVGPSETTIREAPGARKIVQETFRIPIVQPIVVIGAAVSPEALHQIEVYLPEPARVMGVAACSSGPILVENVGPPDARLVVEPFDLSVFSLTTPPRLRPQDPGLRPNTLPPVEFPYQNPLRMDLSALLMGSDLVEVTIAFEMMKYPEDACT